MNLERIAEIEAAFGEETLMAVIDFADVAELCRLAHFRAAEAEVARLTAANGWRPIETALQAPRHMQRVLYWFAPGRSWHVGEYEEPGTFGGRSGFCDTHDAPYWMPLPEPPKENSNG